MLREKLAAYRPLNEQEAADKERMLFLLDACPDTILTRENPLAHFTGSGLIVDRNRQKVLLIYHTLYDAWTWTGGHADGEEDLLGTALREAREETGIRILHPLSPLPVSLDILPVAAHEKRGRYVPPHLHLSFCYSFCAPQDQPLRERPEENSSVGWVPLKELHSRVTEAEMLPIYDKIICRTLLELRAAKETT